MADAARKLDLAKSDRTRHEITAKQEIAIRELLAGKTDEQAAKAASVSRSTVNHWRHDTPPFMAEFATRRAEIWNDTRNTIRELTQAAIAEVGRAVKAEDTRTAIWVLEKCGGFDEIAKEEFASLKAQPVSIGEVLGRFATTEANRNMQSIMKRPPDPKGRFGDLSEFIDPPAPETPEKKKYESLWRSEFDKALSRLREEYVDDEDDGEQE